MLLSNVNGVHMEPQVKPRSLRNIATGKITSQSTNKTKRLLKTGFYVEVMPDGQSVSNDPLLQEAKTMQAARFVTADEQANARKTNPLLWIGVACGSIAAVAVGIVLFIR